MASAALENLLSRAGRIRDAHTAGVDAVRGRTDLVDTARVARIAKVHLDGSTKMRDLRQAFNDDLASRWEAAERTAFSPSGIRENPAAAAAWRHAVTVAADLTDVEAATAALARANRDGDESMAVAIGAHAADRAHGPGAERWGDLVDAFTSTRPHRAAAVETLVEVARDRTSLAASPFALGLPTPMELGYNTTPDRLQSLASAAR